MVGEVVAVRSCITYTVEDMVRTKMSNHAEERELSEMKECCEGKAST